MSFVVTEMKVKTGQKKEEEKRAWAKKKKYGLDNKKEEKRTWATGLLASQLSSSRPLLPRQTP